MSGSAGQLAGWLDGGLGRGRGRGDGASVHPLSHGVHLFCAGSVLWVGVDAGGN